MQFYTFVLLFTSLLAGCLVCEVGAQSRSSDNTLKLDDPANSPAATIGDVAWIAGHWTGEAFGGEVEEYWSVPAGGAMMGMFRAVQGDTLNFYEFFTLSEENGSLLLRIKHFHPDLRGWEPQDESVEFPLVKLEADTVYFDGFTIRKVDDSSMIIYVLIGSKDEGVREMQFPYQRVE